MLKKNLLILFVYLLTVALSAFAASAQTGGGFEPAGSSSVTSAKLPPGALRVAPSSVPAEIDLGLEKIVEAGEGKLVRGDSEVLAWAGEGYTKAKAAGLMTELENSLSASGWKFQVGGQEGEVTFFTALAENPKRRAVVGFFVAGSDGLVVAWTEVLRAESNFSVENTTEIETEFRQLKAARAANRFTEYSAAQNFGVKTIQNPKSGIEFTSRADV